MECLSEERNIGKPHVSSRRPLKPKRRTTLTSWSQSSMWLYRTVRVPWYWDVPRHVLPWLTPRILLHGRLQLILLCDVLKPVTVWKANPALTFPTANARIEQKFSLFWLVCFRNGTIFSVSLFFMSFYNEIWSSDCNIARDSPSSLDVCHVFDIRYRHGV